MIKKLYNRRQALSLFASFAVASACTPLKIVFSNKEPSERLNDQNLIAFTEVIVPGLSTQSEGLINIFYDPYYPFAPYVKIFKEALNKATTKKFKSEKFSELSMEKREFVVKEMLAKKGIVRQFAYAAIFLTQMSVYTGLYNSDGSCELLDFKCIDSETESYPDNAEYSCNPMTKDGNPS